MDDHAGTAVGASLYCQPRSNSVRQRGFTLIELVMVIVISGIIAAFAVGRFIDRKAFDADIIVDRSKGMLRFAQKMAIAQNRPVFVRLDGASIALCFDLACANKVTPPGGVNSASSQTLAACSNLNNWMCEGMPSGISYSLSPATLATPIFFDPLGKPFTASDTFPVVNSSFAQLTIKFAATGETGTHDVVIEAETGYVH
jgi:MSHA pilin protein MshC